MENNERLNSTYVNKKSDKKNRNWDNRLRKGVFLHDK